jgi:hypothetical protein
MKQPTDEKGAALIAACGEVADEKTAEAKASFAALIAGYEADPSEFRREAIASALQDLNLDLFLEDKIDMELFRSAFQKALLTREKSPRS